jgi:hypothetical protein
MDRIVSDFSSKIERYIESVKGGDMVIAHVNGEGKVTFVSRTLPERLASPLFTNMDELEYSSLFK